MWDAWLAQPACSSGLARAGRAGELLAATKEMPRVFFKTIILANVSLVSLWFSLPRYPGSPMAELDIGIS